MGCSIPVSPSAHLALHVSASSFALFVVHLLWQARTALRCHRIRWTCLPCRLRPSRKAGWQYGSRGLSSNRFRTTHISFHRTWRSGNIVFLSRCRRIGSCCCTCKLGQDYSRARRLRSKVLWRGLLCIVHHHSSHRTCRHHSWWQSRSRSENSCPTVGLFPLDDRKKMYRQGWDRR